MDQNSCETNLTRSRCGYIAEISAARKQKVGSHYQAPHFISIVTFNEWEEGSQVEPADTIKTGPNAGKSNTIISAPQEPDDGFRYMGYVSDNPGVAATGPNLYLNVTRQQLSTSLYVPINPNGTGIPDVQP